MKRWHRFAAAAVVLAASWQGALPAFADEDESVADWVSASDFGGVGLLQTRTARFGADGRIDVGASIVQPYMRYYVNLHALPWLEGTFRYTEITNRLYSDDFSFSGSQAYKDRGADIKLRLLKEGRYWPALALVLQDGLGTGQFAGEALVASKRYFDLDFSLGVGWGYTGRGGKFNIKNPMTVLGKQFGSRAGSAGPVGGQFNLGNYFAGETMTPFGGVAYRTPIRGLTFKFELDPNDYQEDPLDNVLTQTSPFNYGFDYQLFSWLDLSLAYERGNTIMFRASARANLQTDKMPKFDPPPPVVGPRPKRDSFGATPPEPEPENEAPPSPLAMPPTGRTIPMLAQPLSRSPTQGDIAATLLDGLGAEGLQLEAIDFSEDETTIGVTGELQTTTQASLMRAARVVTDTVPRAAEKITFVQSRADAEAIRRTVSRGEIENREVVDHLFDRIELLGVEVRSVAFGHNDVELGVSRTSSGGDIDEAGLANLIMLSLPVPVQKLTIVSFDNDVEVSRTTYDRPEVKNLANIDQAFDELERLGLDIQSVEFIKGRLIVRLGSNVAINQIDNARVGAILGDVIEAPIDEISLLGPRPEVMAQAATPGCRDDPCAGSGAENLVHEDIVYEDHEKREVAKRVFETFVRSGHLVHAFHLSGRRATVFVSMGNITTDAQRIGRAARLLANSVPEPVEQLTIVAMNGILESYRVTLRRRDLEMADTFQATVEEVWQRARVEKPKPFGIPDDAIPNSKLFPRVLWSFGPRTRQHIGGPDQFLLYQFWAALHATVSVAPGLGVKAGVGKNLYHNFDKITLESDSKLPRVRSDIKNYLQQGEDNLIRLYADYIFMPIEDVYVRTSAGYFEEMYGGFSGEILYRPFDTRFAFGFDINRVWKREFEQRLGFLDYKATTGHVNLYYHFPFYDLLAEVNIGQYLAEDRGATYSLSRRFKNGVRVGMWATFTNVSAEQFGEGSFDKGIFTSIPFGVFLPFSTTAHGNFAFRPLSRDGGQRLGISNRLYDVSNNATVEGIYHDWRKLLD